MIKFLQDDSGEVSIAQGDKLILVVIKTLPKDPLYFNALNEDILNHCMLNREPVTRLCF